MSLCAVSEMISTSWGIPSVDWAWRGTHGQFLVDYERRKPCRLRTHASHSHWLYRCLSYCRRVSNLHNVLIRTTCFRRLSAPRSSVRRTAAKVRDFAQRDLIARLSVAFPSDALQYYRITEQVIRQTVKLIWRGWKWCARKIRPIIIVNTMCNVRREYLVINTHIAMFLKSPSVLETKMEMWQKSNVTFLLAGWWLNIHRLTRGHEFPFTLTGFCSVQRSKRLRAHVSLRILESDL